MKVIQEIHIPQESVNDQSLIVVGLNFNSGDYVKKNDIVIELETSKAVTTIEAEADGYIVYLCKMGDEVAVNSLIIQIFDSKPESVVAPAEQPQSAPGSLTASELINKTFSPQFSKKALQLIKKHNLPASVFESFDFVNEEIVLDHLQPERKKMAAAQFANAPIENKEWEPLKDVVYEKLPAGKKREIEYLSAVYNNGLVSTLYISVATKKVLSVLNKKLSYLNNSILPVVVLEISRLLLKYPLLNAFFDNNQIGKYSGVQVGVAVDLDDGLKVVKLPDTERLGIFEIEDLIFELSNKYLDKKLSVKDLSGITFTISDMSATGVSFFTPLINKNNSAILGIPKTDLRSGECMLSLSFDHRVTEGKYAANFLTELKSRIESFSFAGNMDDSSVVCYKCLKELTEDLNEKGFVKVQTRGGEEKLICDTCLSNY